MAIAEKDREFMEQVAAYFRSTIDPESMPEGSIVETVYVDGDEMEVELKADQWIQ